MGQIIAAVIAVIDAVIALVCGVLGEDFEEGDVGQYLCKGIEGWLSEVIAWHIYGQHAMVNMEDSDRLKIGGPVPTLLHPQDGFSQGNQLSYSLPLTNTIDLLSWSWQNTQLDWKALVYRWQFNNSNLKSSTFSYALSTQEQDIHGGLDRGSMSGEWRARDNDDDAPYYIARNVTIASAIPITRAGINVSMPLYLAEGAVLPVQECFVVPNPPACVFAPGVPFVCLIPICHIRDKSNTAHINLGSSIQWDIFPATLDEFHALSWGDFPAQRDHDGDGLLSRGSGGSDPNDRTWDSDGDGLSDFYEEQTGSNLQSPDSDGDGQNDRAEALLGSNPNRNDSDGDGLTDQQEVTGWEFVYDFAADGSQLRTWVTSDPLTVDGDGDTLTDAQEKIFGFHPRVWSDPNVLKYEAQMYEQAAGGTRTPTDGFVKPNDTLYYKGRARNELFNRYANGLLYTDFPSSVAHAIHPTTFILQPQQEATLSGNVQIRSDAPSGGVDLTQTAGATIVNRREASDYADLWLKFDEPAGSARFADSSGSMPEPYAFCSPRYRCPTAGMTGTNGSALYFDGVDNGLSFYQSSGILDYGADQDFTIALWVKTTGWSGFAHIIGYSVVKLFGSGDGSTWGASIIDSGRTYVDVNGGAIDDDQWHHIAATFTRRGDLILYEDGVQVGRRSIAHLVGLYNLFGDWFTIGHNYNPWGRGHFRGSMDDVRIYPRALRADEIRDLITQPVLHLQFEEPSGDFYDNYGNRASVWQGSPTRVPGIQGQGIQFREGDMLCVHRNPNLDLSDGRFTVSAWVNYTGNGGNALGNRHYPSLSVWPPEIRVSILGYGSSMYGPTNYPLSPHTWYHLVGTFDGVTYRLYVDGVSIWTSDTFSGQRPSANRLFLGTGYGGSYNAFDGVIDEVSIYRQVLTPEQVDALYRSSITSLHFPFDEPPGAGESGDFANLVDLRGFSNGTCTGAACPASGVYGRINQALQFDGVDDTVTLSDVDLSGDFAIAAWFKTPTPSDGRIKPLISKQLTNSNPTGDSAELNFQIEGNGNLKFFMSSDSAPYDVNMNGGVLAADRWYHAVVVMQNNNATLYVNGAPVATEHFDGARRNSSLPLLLGTSNPGPQYFRGKIDDLRAFSKALSPSEIQALYQSAPTLMLHLDEAAGATVFSDASGNGLNTWSFDNYCPQAEVKGQIGTAVEFNTWGRSILIPDNPLLDLATFSVGAWVKPVGPKNGYQPLIVKENTYGGSRNYGMFINPNAMTVHFSFQAADCATWRSYDSHNSLIQNTWNHVMMTYDGAKFNFYLNGNLDRSESVSGVPCQNNGNLVIGHNTAVYGYTWFAGRIDEVTINRRALSSYEVDNIYEHQSKWVEERQTFHLTVDAEDPVSTLRSTEPQYRANRDVVLDVGALDATSHVTGVEFGVRRAGQASFTWTPAPECMDAADQAAWCPTFDPTTLGGEGRYYLQTRATDLLGHVETPAATHTFYVDDTPPNAAYTGQALLAPVIHPTQENTLLVSLSGTVSDPNLSSGDAGSGAARVYVALLDAMGNVAGAGEVQAAVTNGQWQVDYIFTNRDPSGAYTLRVTSEDAVGNRRTETLTTIAIDASPSTPDMNLTGVPEGAIVTPLTLQGDVSEWPGTGDATLHLRFEEAAGATSFLNSAGGDPATCSGAYCPSAGQSGQLGNAVSFNGPRWQVVSLPGQAVNHTGDGTIVTWLYLDRRDEETIFSRWTGTPSGYNGNLHLLSVGYTGGLPWRKVAGDDGRLYFAVGWDDDSPRLQSNAILNTGQWYHVAVVFSDSEASFYINGFLDNTANGDFSVSTSSGAAQLGKWMDSTLEFLDGKLDETRVYDRVLSGNEISALAQTTFGGVQGVDVAIRSTTPGSPLYNQAPPAGQILHLPFDDQVAQDGSLSFRDISGGNHTGTCSGDNCPAVGAKGHTGGGSAV